MATDKLARRSDAADPAQFDIRYANVSDAGEWITDEAGYTVSAFWRCVNLVASSVAGLPWRHHERRPSGGSKIIDGSALDVALHIQANSWMTALTWRELMMNWVLVHGNAYAEIDRVGRQIQLWPISPTRCRPKLTPEGRLAYEVDQLDGSKIYLGRRDVFHLHGLSGDGLIGYSVIEFAARSLGTTIGADRYAGRFYRNGAVPSGVVETDHIVDEETWEKFKSRMEESHAGSGNAHKLMLFEAGLKWKQTALNAEQSQFLESRRFQIGDVARWFGVPPHMVGDLEKATLNNIEQENRRFATDAIVPWILRLESEAQAKLIPANRPAGFTRINWRAIVRGDLKAQSEYYARLQQTGALTTNEIRELEDMNPVVDGDRRFISANLKPIEAVDGAPTGPPGAGGRPAAGDAVPPPAPGGPAPAAPNEEPAAGLDRAGGGANRHRGIDANLTQSDLTMNATDRPANENADSRPTMGLGGPEDCIRHGLGAGHPIPNSSSNLPSALPESIDSRFVFEPVVAAAARRIVRRLMTRVRQKRRSRPRMRSDAWSTGCRAALLASIRPDTLADLVAPAHSILRFFGAEPADAVEIMSEVTGSWLEGLPPDLIRLDEDAAAQTLTRAVLGRLLNGKDTKNA